MTGFSSAVNSMAAAVCGVLISLSVGTAAPGPTGTASDDPMKTEGKPQSGLLDVGGSKLFYEVCGEGRPFVLVHDGVLHRETWNLQWDALCERFRVVRYDRRGYGKSSVPTQPYSDVDDLRALVEHLGLEKFMLAGGSAGSNVAMQYTLQYPKSVRRLILVGPVVSGFGYTEHFFARNREVLRPLFEANDIEKTIDNLMRDRYTIAEGNEEARRQARALLSANPQNLTHPYLTTSGEPALPRLSEINVPTLILVGEADIPDVHAHAGAIESRIPRARRRIIPGAGHLPYLEKPEEFRKLLLEFLESRQP